MSLYYDFEAIDNIDRLLELVILLISMVPIEAVW